MRHIALLPSAVACCLLACSNPASNDRTIQQFTGSIVITPQDGATGHFDAGARFTLQSQGAVDARATVSPMSDLKFRLAVKLEGGYPVLPGEPALPPTLTARWDGLAPGTYRVIVYPVEGQPRPSSPQTFSVSGTISYP